jgi:hypothetical protein
MLARRIVRRFLLDGLGAQGAVRDDPRTCNQNDGKRNVNGRLPKDFGDFQSTPAIQEDRKGTSGGVSIPVLIASLTR